MKAAMIFPGQGSQYVGMGMDLRLRFPSVKDIYAEADEVLGFAISTLSFEGDPAVLTETRNAQPAILLHSIAVARVLMEEAGVEPAIAAGHSLGEYSALAVAGVMDPMDALRIVRRRGELMFEAGVKQPGTMAAVIGLDRGDVEAICAEASSGGLVAVVANINSPGQIVISGHVEAVEKAMEKAAAKGAKKAIRLNVSGAFHSPLVAPAQNELVEYIRSFDLRDAAVDVVCNADARIVRSRGEIVEALSRQLTSPVLWSDSMEILLSRWNGPVIEAGPGKVLAGLLKRIDRDREAVPAGTLEDIEKFLARRDGLI